MASHCVVRSDDYARSSIDWYVHRTSFELLKFVRDQQSRSAGHASVDTSYITGALKQLAAFIWIEVPVASIVVALSLGDAWRMYTRGEAATDTSLTAPTEFTFAVFAIDYLEDVLMAVTLWLS